MNTTSEPSSPSNHAHRLARALGLTLLLPLSPVLLSSCTEAEAADGEVEALEARIDQLESKEEVRAMVMGFATIVDNADLAGLTSLSERIHPEFSMDVVDFDGGEYHFEGLDGLLEEYGPIMVSAQANLAVSEIAVELDGDNATAHFKFVNSVKPPPELAIDIDEKVLLLAANTATFVREDGVWKLQSLELIHSLGYPGTLEGLGG